MILREQSHDFKRAVMILREQALATMMDMDGSCS